MNVTAQRGIAGDEIVDLVLKVDFVNAFQMILQVAEFDDGRPLMNLGFHRHDAEIA